VPVISTDVGGVRELIIEGDVFEVKNYQQLGEKIMLCLNKTINRKKLAEQASQKFSYQIIGQQLYKIYKEVCAE
jgi:glycosyltransferase involved in cell wall biosynthesis